MKEKENWAGTTLTILGDLKLSYFTVFVKEGCSHSLRTQHKYHKSYFSISLHWHNLAFRKL